MRLGFSCCARKAQASRFGTKTQLAGRTLTPMPPVGGGLTAELRHKSETHIGAVICSAAWGPSCRRVRIYRLPAHPCRSAPHKRHVRPPCGAKGEGWHQASSRLTNRTKEMIHNSITQPSITRNIPSASAVCTRYHG